MGSSMIEIEICAERLQLLPTRAVHWPHKQALIVADVHLGKAATFQHFGVPVPDGVGQGSTRDDLARLSVALAQTQARSLYILGDLLHAAKGRAEHVLDLTREWRDRHRDVAMTLVRGNHDSRAGDPPEDWRIECVDEPFQHAPFVLCHHPGAGVGQGGYELAGHLHPGVTLTGRGRQRERLASFIFGEQAALLPAFGSFTGLASVPRNAGDRVFVVAGEKVLALS